VSLLLTIKRKGGAWWPSLLLGILGRGPIPFTAQDMMQVLLHSTTLLHNASLLPLCGTQRECGRRPGRCWNNTHSVGWAACRAPEWHTDLLRSTYNCVAY
jgi:hypothetical protein